MSALLPAGTKLGKYELIRQIAIGGMAELYLARTVGIEGFEKLVVLKNNYKLLHPTDPFPGIAIIQADKGVEFKALKKVMYSAATAGYNNVNFAVKAKARAGGAPAAVE